MAKKARTSRHVQMQMQIMKKAFAKRLRAARERAGYASAQSFAAVLGQEPHTYRHWERGEAEPDFETMTRICELLRVTPNDLLLPQAAQAACVK